MSTAPTTQNELDGLLPLKEAAHRLNVSEKTARRLAIAGAGVRIGGRWRLDLAKVRGGAR